MEGNSLPTMWPLPLQDSFQPRKIRGGAALELGALSFDTISQDISNARGYIQLANVAWTASGGQIPVNGTGARYAVMIGPTVINAAMREIFYYWDLTSPRTVSDGQTLTLIDMESRINES